MYCVAVLHHVAEPIAVRSTIREMWRVVRPGGVAVYWDHNPLNPYWPIIMARVPQDTGEERLISAREIRSALKDLPSAITSYSSGFVGDFVPVRWLSVFQKLERVIEATPGLRRIAVEIESDGRRSASAVVLFAPAYPDDLKIERLQSYTPVAPDETDHMRYKVDCMRGPGHEDGTIPPNEVERRRRYGRGRERHLRRRAAR